MESVKDRKSKGKSRNVYVKKWFWNCVLVRLLEQFVCKFSMLIRSVIYHWM